MKRKSIGNIINRTRQTHRCAILIRPMKANKKSRDTIKEEALEKKTRTYQIMREINGIFADDSI